MNSIFSLIICSILFFNLSIIAQEYIEAAKLFQIKGENPGDRFGNGSFAGDINGDGIDDLIIRGHYNDENGLNSGKAYIYLGSTNFSNQVDFEFLGENQNDVFGAVVSSAGDFNNDGYGDFLVSSPYYDNLKGKTYLFLGGNNINESPAISFIGNEGNRLSICETAGDLNGDGFDDIMIGTAHTNFVGFVNIYFGGSTLDDEPSLVLHGEDAEDKYGSYLAALGDVNGDGYDDIIVSGHRNYSNASIGGRTYVYFGGENMDNLPDLIMTGNEQSGYFGWTVSGAGDVNNDGFDDILVGAWAEDAGGHDNGKAYLYFGSNNMDNIPDVVFSGKQYGENFGKSLAGIGDINGDGFDDFIIGAPGNGEGKAYLYYGSNNLTDAPNIIFEGENFGDGFGSVKYTGDLNNDGLTDVLIGADLNSDNGTDAGKSYIYFSGTNHETPTIVEQHHHIIINEGETATLEVHATCSDSIGYQWWKVPYTGPESKIVDLPDRFEGSTTNQLKILNTTKIEDDNTQYLCEVYNTVDPQNLWINSENITLNINKIEQVISVNIDSDTLWFDENYDGVELGEVDASLSSVNIGSINEFIWTLNSDTIGFGVKPIIELPTGTNIITLTVLTDMGNIKQVSKYIDVYAAKLETEGELHSSVSWLNNKSLFISSTDDKVYKFDSTGTVDWTILTGGSILSTVCVSDENNIYVGSTDTRLYAFDNNGAPRWDKAMGGIINSSPSVGPDNSIYLGLNSGRLFSLSEDGVLNWSMQANGAIISSPSVTNERIYFGSADKNVYSLSTETGAILNTFTTEDTVISTAAISKDGNVFIGGNDGYLYKFDGELNLIWKFYTLGKVTTSPVIDEIGNVFVGSESGFIYALSPDRMQLWKFETGSPVTGNPSIGPNGNLYVGCENGRFLVLNRNGKLLWDFYTSNSIQAAALISTDNIIYLPSTDGNVYIMKEPYMYYGFGYPTQPFEWPTYKGNNNRTGFITFNPVNVDEFKKQIPSEFALLQNFPNPFNPSTIIKYSIVKKGHVKLSIYDLLGKEISSIVNKIQTPGSYSVSIDAGMLSSGIYIYRLQTDEFIESRKMILLK